MEPPRRHVDVYTIVCKHSFPAVFVPQPVKMSEELDLDKSQSNATNLAVLQRNDPDVLEIISSAAHVAIYGFDQAGQSWVRTSTWSRGQSLQPQRTTGLECHRPP